MGMVYLIRAGNRYKIGKTSRDIKKRLKEIDTSNHEDLEVVCEYETMYDSLLEKTLHRKYSLNNLKNEWFDLDETEVKMFRETCKNIVNVFMSLKENGNPYVK
jgi:chromosome segregation ATPase